MKSYHEGERPHKCSVCDENFMMEQDLNHHVRTIHEGEKPPEWICNICGKISKTKGALKSHTENVHERKKPHKCEVEGCDAGFHTKVQLR